VQREANVVHTAESSELGHEAAVRPKRAADALKRCALVANPVQDRIAERSVEFVDERQILDAARHRVEAAGTRAAHLRFAGVDADDAATRGNQLFRQRTITAADVEHPLARSRL
jgi:hypothetical protein